MKIHFITSYVPKSKFKLHRTYKFCRTYELQYAHCFFGAKTEDPSPLSYFCTLLEHCLPPSECKYFLNDPIVYTDFIVDFIHCDYLTKTKFLQEQKTDNLKNTLSYFAILFI